MEPGSDADLRERPAYLHRDDVIRMYMRSSQRGSGRRFVERRSTGLHQFVVSTTSFFGRVIDFIDPVSAQIHLEGPAHRRIDVIQNAVEY